MMMPFAKINKTGKGGRLLGKLRILFELFQFEMSVKHLQRTIKETDRWRIR